MDIQKVREQFPILSRKINDKSLIYFDNAATTQKPKKVVEALVDFYYNHNANIHRGVHTLSIEATEMVDMSRKKVADFIGASVDEIVFVRNATEAINLVMYSLGEQVIGASDNVVISMMEHHSNLVPWQVLCQKRNAGLRVISVDGDGRLVSEQNITQGDGWETGGWKQLVDGNTKILALSYVSNVTGVINPIREIVTECKKINPELVVLVDASQATGHFGVDVKQLGADLIVFSGHKMNGPTGVGVLWGKKALLERMPPFLYGGDMISEVKLGKTSYAGVPNKFEAGTVAIAEIIGLASAVDFLQELGMEQIEMREKELTELLVKKMNQLQQKGVVKIIGPKDTQDRAALVSFNVAGVHAHDLATFMDNQGIAIRSGQRCSAPLVESFGEMATARISLSYINTEEEIEFAMQVIEDAYRYFVK